MYLNSLEQGLQLKKNYHQYVILREVPTKSQSCSLPHWLRDWHLPAHSESSTVKEIGSWVFEPLLPHDPALFLVMLLALLPK